MPCKPWYCSKYLISQEFVPLKPEYVQFQWNVVQLSTLVFLNQLWMYMLTIWSFHIHLYMYALQRFYPKQMTVRYRFIWLSKPWPWSVALSTGWSCEQRCYNTSVLPSLSSVTGYNLLASVTLCTVSYLCEHLTTGWQEYWRSGLHRTLWIHPCFWCCPLHSPNTHPKSSQWPSLLPLNIHLHEWSTKHQEIRGNTPSWH